MPETYGQDPEGHPDHEEYAGRDQEKRERLQKEIERVSERIAREERNRRGQSIERDTTRTRDESLIFREMMATHRAAAELHELLSELSEVLGPVLGPPRPRPQGDDDSGEREERSVLTDEIERVGNHLHEMSGMVRDLLAQLEV